MGISLAVSGSIPLYTPPAITPTVTVSPVAAPQPVSDTVQISTPSLQVTTQAVNADIGAKYQEAIAQIVSSFKNDYAVSDQQLSIFKDATGTLITRYVSLRDGTVTYLPTTPTVVRPLSFQAGGVGITA